MSERKLITNAMFQGRLCDILIEGERIAVIAPAAGPNLNQGTNTETKQTAVSPGQPPVWTTDARGLTATQAFADVHVHFREPGFPEKETILTGSRAAAAGGYSIVCPMPNLDPVPDSPQTIGLEREIIGRDAVVDVRPYSAITKGRKGTELVDFGAMKDLCVAFSDDGSGVQSDTMMLRAMEAAAREDCIIAAHCEDTTWGDAPRSEWGQIERDLRLCEETGCRYHVCHISTAHSVELIRDAKKRGINVTCETAPHYLTLCDEDLEPLGRFRMNPPIRSRHDLDALVEGLRDGTIDMIATDHAPHTAEQKSRGFLGSAMGIVGLETAFPVLYTRLVLEGRVSLERLLDAMNAAPRRCFRLGDAFGEGGLADVVLLDLDTAWTIDSNTFQTKGRSTPFEGWEVRGRVAATFCRGRMVYNSCIE